MGHVDDAHQSVGDGQPQGDQQQDRTQADAAEHGTQFIAPSQCGFDGAQTVCQRCFDIGFSFGFQALKQHGLGGGIGTGG